MQESKEYLKDNNIVPRISFKKDPKHQLKLISDKKDSIQDENGLVVEGMKYEVEENGEKKTFFTTSVGLIQELSQRNEGDVVVIEMKSKKGNNGFITYFEVTDVK